MRFLSFCCLHVASFNFFVWGGAENIFCYVREHTSPPPHYPQPAPSIGGPPLLWGVFTPRFWGGGERKTSAAGKRTRSSRGQRSKGLQEWQDAHSVPSSPAGPSPADAAVVVGFSEECILAGCWAGVSFVFEL